ncbi:MAG: periplasmic heavy metal sensor [Roseibium sp.]|nr:periplasmic heavy metal sensor [Roseibium sp.]
MKRLRIVLIAVGVVSVLFNVVFAGIATRVYLRSNEGSLAGVFFSLPEDVRRNLRRDARQDDGGISNARDALQQTRRKLQNLMEQDQPDIDAIAATLGELRQNTQRLQIEVHSAIVKSYAAQQSE